MGCDGGTIPKRHELVKTAGKPEQPDNKPLPNEAWFYCALSKEPLQEPIVSDALGKLYNRESMIHYLLDKSKYGDGESICGHIKSLKDVLTLRLERKAEEEVPSSSSSSYGKNKLEAKFVCPITRKEMDGHFRFLFLKGCGCVFSEKALKELPSEHCLICNKSFALSDMIFINGKPEEIEIYRKNMASFGSGDRSSHGSKKKVKTTTAALNKTTESLHEPMSESLKRKEKSSVVNVSDELAKKSIYKATDSKFESLKKIESIQSIYTKSSQDISTSSTSASLFHGTIYR